MVRLGSARLGCETPSLYRPFTDCSHSTVWALKQSKCNWQLKFMHVHPLQYVQCENNNTTKQSVREHTQKQNKKISIIQRVNRSISTKCHIIAFVREAKSQMNRTSVFCARIVALCSQLSMNIAKKKINHNIQPKTNIGSAVWLSLRFIINIYLRLF